MKENNLVSDLFPFLLLLTEERQRLEIINDVFDDDMNQEVSNFFVVIHSSKNDFDTYGPNNTSDGINNKGNDDFDNNNNDAFIINSNACK